MPAPSTTIWGLEPHSRAKHEILKRYMQAWMPILGQSRFPEISYIDGFAGPGRYSKGEYGSPIIALRAALEQQKRINPTISFLFVERDSDRADMLRAVLDGIPTPPQFSVRIEGGRTFEEVVTEYLDARTGDEQRMPPTFAFIDPFGWSGVPFNLVRRILSYPNCEVLVTFMYEEINRFIGHPDQGKNFDSFFGTEEWRQIIPVSEPRERNRRLHDLYLNQLRDSAGVQYVRSFEMRNDRDVTDYFLFYATNNRLGLEKMKAAMWKVDGSGEFRFSDATNPLQSVFFINEPQFDVLKAQIFDRFQGEETTVAEIEEFVLSDTAFRETHYKGILRQLERNLPPGLVAIDPPTGRGIGTYSDPSLKLRFTSTEPFQQPRLGHL